MKPIRLQEITCIRKRLNEKIMYLFTNNKQQLSICNN